MPVIDRYPSVSGEPCIDPGPLKESLDKAGVDTPFWGLANSIHCPVGMEPGSAWFLVTRASAIYLQDRGNQFHNLAWGNSTATAATWFNYVLHRGVGIGVDGDSNMCYLLEFRDKRQVLKLSAIDKQYNVRTETRKGNSSGSDLYYTSTTNGGTDWTWQTMFTDVWDHLPAAIRGTAPTLATSGYVPSSEPENFRFHGSAWEAIGFILAATHNVLCYDPFTEAFTVQKLGSAQSGLTTANTDLLNAGRSIISDRPMIDLNLSVMPATIRFYFPKRQELEGWLIETIAGGALVDPYYTVDVSTGASGAQTGTVMPYRTRFFAEVDADGSTINNSGTLSTLANNLATAITARINVATERGFAIWSGIAPNLTPGCEVHEIIWRDLGDRDGCVTEWRKDPSLGYAEQAEPIFPKAFTGEMLVKNDSGGDYAAESGLHTFEVWVGTPGAETYSGIDVSAFNASGFVFRDQQFGSCASLHGGFYAVPFGTT